MDNSNKKFWGKVAKLYTTIQEKGNRKLYSELCKRIAPLFKKNHKVLELACGTGQLTFSLAEKTRTWLATDFSEPMVKEAEKRSQADNIKFQVQDATALTFDNESFDVVLIANALHIMPNPNAALEEIKRVLKNDGILIAPTFVYDGKIKKIRIWFMEKFGFKTFHKWKAKEYVEYVEKQGFQVKRKALIQGEMLPDCIVVCKKSQ